MAMTTSSPTLCLVPQEAEKLVASLQDSCLEEERFTAAMQAPGLRHSAAATALPLSHGAARKWFYKDPQGEIQGACRVGQQVRAPGAWTRFL